MKRIVPLILGLIAVTVLAQQSVPPSAQTAQTAIRAAVAAATSTVTARAASSFAASPTSLPDGPRSRSDSFRSRRFESNSSSAAPGLVIPPPKPLGADYSILTQRSMFVKGVFSYPSGNSRSFRTYSSTTMASTTQTQYDPPEQNLVLNGVVKQDNEFVAFVENYSNSDLRTLRSGDPVANGKVGAMTLNYMDYVSGGRTTRVSIGKTLLGGDPPASRPYAIGSTVAPDSSSPSSPGSSASPTVGALAPPSDALIERLKKKREAEMTGK